MPKVIIIGLVAGALLLGCTPDQYSNIKNIHRATGNTIVCFGNSLTAGQGAPLGSDYPTLLAQKLALPVINSGIPGDTAEKAMVRIERDVLVKNPRVVIVELGGNDFLAMGGRGNVTPIFQNLSVIIERIQEHGAVVVLAGLSETYAIQEGYRKLAAAKGALLIPDIMAGIYGNSALMSDPIHPNAQGYIIMAENMLKVLIPLLGKMR